MAKILPSGKSSGSDQRALSTFCTFSVPSYLNSSLASSCYTAFIRTVSVPGPLNSSLASIRCDVHVGKTEFPRLSDVAWSADALLHTAAVTAHYQSMHAAVKMLISRIHALHGLVSQMQTGGRLLMVHRPPARSSGPVAGARHVAVFHLMPKHQTLLDSVILLMAGALPYDHQLVRQAATLVRRLPVLDTPQFHEDYLTASCKPMSLETTHSSS